jgi:hypothetical protein
MKNFRADSPRRARRNKKYFSIRKNGFLDEEFVFRAAARRE